MHKVAIIGAGGISAWHYPGWKKAESVTLAAIVDIRAEQARGRAAEWGVDRWETDYHAVLEDPEITICDICLPHHLHRTVTIDCLRAGKHVLLEKPIAMNLEEAREIMAVHKESDRVLMVAENWYFAPTVTRAMEILRSGEVGEPVSLHANLDYPGLRTLPREKAYVRGVGWREQGAQSGGGVLMDGGVHTISVARLIMGEVATVWGVEGKQAWKAETGLEDTFTAIFKFERDTTGLFHFADASGRERPYFDFTVMGTDGVLEFDIWTGIVRAGKGNRFVEYRESPYGGFVEEILHFVECVESGKEPLSTPEDQTRSLAAVLALYRSAANGGAPVALSALLDEA